MKLFILCEDFATSIDNIKEVGNTKENIEACEELSQLIYEKLLKHVDMTRAIKNAQNFDAALNLAVLGIEPTKNESFRYVLIH